MRKRGLEKEIQMILVGGVTPEEIALEYARIGTEAFTKATTQFSINHGEMLLFAPQYVTLREIGDKYFAEIEYTFYANDEDENDDA